MAASLIIIVAGRERHLRNLLRGVEQSSLQPQEIIIVSMAGALHLETKLPVKIVHLPSPEHLLPLAAARNAGAHAALSDQLVFLDVDCVPAPDFIATITRHLTEFGGLIMGTPRYLAEPIADSFSVADLQEKSAPHPVQPVLSVPCQASADYHLFWSNCFAIHAADFRRIGGFDPHFVGYGGEDTDFAFTARKLGVPFFHSAASVYHQPHHSPSPPVQHLAAIVRNANLFQQKWQLWPMEGWLHVFQQRRLIAWNPASPAPIQLLGENAAGRTRTGTEG